MAFACFKPMLDLIGLGSSKSDIGNASRGQSTSESTAKLIESHEKIPIIEDNQSTPTLSKDSKILIVGGGGTIGSSTALHLSRRGYTNIHILDVFPIPSGNSAGNDLNKIIGFSTDHRGFRAELSKKYMEGWTTDPLFKPFYHATGMLQAAHDPVKIKHMKDAYEDAVKHGWAELAQLEWLGSEEDVLRRAPHLKGGDIQGWQALWAGNAGWAAAREAIASVGEELERHGVEMTFGPAGTFKKPLLSSDGKTCLGVIAADDTQWSADRVILATGAWSPSLIDLKGQCTSKCWIIGHLQLTPEEAALLKGIPVVYHDEIGFFFEPYLETGIIKVCDEFPGYTRYRSTTPFGSHGGPQEISVPRSHAVHPSDTMPAEGEVHVKRVIQLLLSQYRDRELVDQKMCWCTDTDDAQWLFCEDPRWKGFYLATGDSGHTFHTLPYVGHEVADMLEGKLSEEKTKAWGWRPGHGDPTGSGRGGPAPKDINDLPGWAHGDPEDAE